METSILSPSPWLLSVFEYVDRLFGTTVVVDGVVVDGVAVDGIVLDGVVEGVVVVDDADVVDGVVIVDWMSCTLGVLF